MRSKADQLSVFPVFIKVADRLAVVVGNGDEALAKARLLKESRIAVRLVAPLPTRELGVFVIQADIDHVAAPFSPDMVEGAAMVFAATGARAEDEAVVAAARARNIPANAVDRPELCDFYTPALVNRAPVAVAIGSEGTGPVFVQILRSRIEALLPRSTGQLARLADRYRGLVDRLVPKGAPRRRFWRAFFQGGIAQCVDGGDLAEARRLASRLLKEPEAGTGFVSLVGAGPGAPDLLTLRGQRALQEADVILHDRLVPDSVVALARRDARRIAVGKSKGGHSASQDEINGLIVSLAGSGQRVVRLKSGDPLVFGRAGEEMEALRQAGIAFEIVPGVTSALAAAAEARIPLTLRGVASSLVFATGHDRDMQVLPDWARLALTGATVAVYMGRTVAADVAARLFEAGLSPDTPVAIVEAAATPSSRLEAGTLGDLAKLEPGRASDLPELILIGQAVARGDLARAYPIVQPLRADALAA